MLRSRYIRYTALFAIVAFAALALYMPQPAKAAPAYAPSQLQGHDSQNLRWLQENHPTLYSQIAALPWVADGLSDMERVNLDELLYVGFLDIPTLEALVPMPFLSTADATDALALQSIYRLAITGQLNPLTEHSVFLDGIDDDETTLVAAAGTVYPHPEEIGNILTPGYMFIESVTTDAGMRLSILRPGTTDLSVETMGVLEDAVEFVETTMGVPLPTGHVILVLHDKAVLEGAGGVNYGFAISYLPQYERPGNTWRWWHFRKAIAHEVAHYFWRGSENWIDEGLAVTMERMYGLSIGLSPGQLKRPRRDCELHDLQMLSEKWPGPEDPQFYCNYYLGSRLFDDLRDGMTEEEFWDAAADLYSLTIAVQESRRTPGIDEVRQVFSAQAEIVERHWSGALNAPENRPFDEGVDRTTHDLVQWNEYPTYDRDSNTVTFSGALLEGAVLTDISLGSGGNPSFSLSTADAQGSLGSILPPLSGNNAVLNNPGDTIASIYQVAESEFTVTFPFPLDGSPPDYVVVVWGFRDERRSPIILSHVDPLGYARIRIPPTTGSVVGDIYDGNRNGRIEADEVRDAIRDWFTEPVGSVVNTDQVRELIYLYFRGIDELAGDGEVDESK